MTSIEKTTLIQLLDLSYELEGLLQLSISRENPPARIAELLRGKLDTMQRLIAPDAPSAPADSSTVEIPAPAPESIVSESVEAEAEILPSETEIEENAASNSTQDADEPDCSYELSDDDEVVTAPPASPAAPVTDTPVQSQYADVPRGAAPVFSINDRFYYARELFGGNISDFEQSLKAIAAMDSYEEAEEYYISEWNLDPENPVVADFMMVISNYFI